ncbi:methyltransferase GliN [Lophiostoma macrostomum CBS 122681]|uniref:Methyltransferase GliN n=1 Tax=Lophiostoma macrostomum CBS 122681 TaxID=1314788 RepID=A0A6A6TAU8_9PLEO|nr:methyltransferase GliN [Lophiostoma macrostomum CBS 122681]
MSSTLDKDKADPSRAGFYKGMEIRQNDEYGRLRRQHLLHKTVMGNKLIRVPLPTQDKIQILDSGTGDGIWMLDAADEYPNAMFVGADIQPRHFEQIKNLPPSITFKVQNLLDNWPAEDQGMYDLVHQRYCLAQFTEEKDLNIVSKLLGLVKPGGFVQFVEADMTSFKGGNEHPGMSEFMRFCERAFPEAKMNPRPGPRIKEWLKESGAVDVTEDILSFEMGVSALSEEMRTETTDNMLAIIANFATVCLQMPNYWYTASDFETLKNLVAEELDTVGNTWRFWVVTAKKH